MRRVVFSGRGGSESGVDHPSSKFARGNLDRLTRIMSPSSPESALKFGALSFGSELASPSLLGSARSSSSSLSSFSSSFHLRPCHCPSGHFLCRHRHRHSETQLFLHGFWGPLGCRRSFFLASLIAVDGFKKEKKKKKIDVGVR